MLARYSVWLMSQRQHGWNVIDIHTPLNTYLAERRKTEPNFAFAGDGVHLNEIGHRLIAQEILAAWGAPAEWLPPVELTPLTGREHDARTTFSALVHARQRRLSPTLGSRTSAIRDPECQKECR